MEQISNLRAFKRHARPILAGIALGITVIWAQSALASPLQPLENMAKEGATCARAIAKSERRHGIPQGLLKAISHAESGRWDAQNGEILAWPWTVTTGGKGHFLPNRIDAVAFVRALQADGVENIDVGCMQINLKYHPQAFPSIEQAFNPHANAAYAANFLRERFASTKSWILAAGDYHSTTPSLNKAYRQKVAKLWQDTQTPATTQVASASSTSSYLPPDSSLNKRFNKAFRERRKRDSILGTGQAIANRLNALKPGAHLGRAAGQSQADRFARNRQSQLMAWRQNNGFAPSTPPK